jgi:hypothetical protein
MVTSMQQTISSLSMQLHRARSNQETSTNHGVQTSFNHSEVPESGYQEDSKANQNQDNAFLDIAVI